MNVNLSAASWFKSSHSNADQDCVEVAFLTEGMVGLRDAKNPGSGALVFTPGEWAAFTADVAGGKFDRSHS